MVCCVWAPLEEDHRYTINLKYFSKLYRALSPLRLVNVPKHRPSGANDFINLCFYFTATPSPELPADRGETNDTSVEPSPGSVPIEVPSEYPAIYINYRIKLYLLSLAKKKKKSGKISMKS